MKMSVSAFRLGDCPRRDRKAAIDGPGLVRTLLTVRLASGNPTEQSCKRILQEGPARGSYKRVLQEVRPHDFATGSVPIAYLQTPHLSFSEHPNMTKPVATRTPT